MNAQQVRNAAERINDSTGFQLLARVCIILSTLAMPIATTILWRTYDAINGLDRNQARMMEQIASIERRRMEDRADYERRLAETRSEMRDANQRLWDRIQVVGDRMGGR